MALSLVGDYGGSGSSSDESEEESEDEQTKPTKPQVFILVQFLSSFSLLGALFRLLISLSLSLPSSVRTSYSSSVGVNVCSCLPLASGTTSGIYPFFQARLHA